MIYDSAKLYLFRRIAIIIALSFSDLGYPTNYRPTVPQSPYSVQTPNPQQGMMSPPQLQSMMSPSQPQGMMSPSHGSYSGSLQQQQQLNVPGMQPQEPVQSPGKYRIKRKQTSKEVLMQLSFYKLTVRSDTVILIRSPFFYLLENKILNQIFDDNRCITPMRVTS